MLIIDCNYKLKIILHGIMFVLIICIPTNYLSVGRIYVFS